MPATAGAKVLAMSTLIRPASTAGRPLNDARSTGSGSTRRVADIDAARGTLAASAPSVRKPVGRARP
jgi:hypothetical protein